jgi:uncharacterized membrane protein YjgN (DUF898 family)
MTAFACKGCGQAWPTNYCPICRASIVREQVATATATLEAPAGRTAVASFRPLSAPGQVARFEFTGNAGEYFRIWVVNLVLTLLTLGIYAAWAKVRKRRYFWSNVQLGGRSFEYTGNAVAILKGNLILGTAAVAYYVLLRVQPLLGIASALVFGLVYPWLYQQAMRFNAWNTRHRNIRFGFHGEVGQSYAVNLGLPMLTPLTLGLLWPYVLYRRKRYQLENLSFGSAQFEFESGAGPFYEYGLKAFGMVMLGFTVFVVTLSAGSARLTSPAVLVGGFLFYLSILLAFGVYYATRITNAVLGSTSVHGVGSFRSTLSVREVLALESVNALATVLTLGFATPWASMRRARYRWAHIELELRGPIETVTALVTPAPGAMGDVAADQFDIDIAL